MGLNCPTEVETQFPKNIPNTTLRDHCVLCCSTVVLNGAQVVGSPNLVQSSVLMVLVHLNVCQYVSYHCFGHHKPSRGDNKWKGGLFRLRISPGGGGGRGVFQKLHLMLEQQLVGKSFQKWPPVFDHFCICWCKVARCFSKRLHFWPLVTLQRKSLPNLTPVSGPILEERKVCELIARWRCQPTIHC